MENDSAAPHDVDQDARPGRPWFQRVDRIDSVYNRVKRCVVCVFLWLPQVRAIFIVLVLCLYWAHLTLLAKLGRALPRFFTERRRQCVAAAVVKPGASFLLAVCFAIYSVRRHSVTQQDLQNLQQDLQHLQQPLSNSNSNSNSSNLHLSTTTTNNGSASIPENRLHKPPFIVVSNHLTFFDPAICMREFGELSFVAKGAIESYPIIGVLAAQLRCLLVRTRGGILPQIRQRLDEYYNDNDNNDGNQKRPRLMLFPEATTTNGEYMLSFHEGAFKLGEPVQPMVIRFRYKEFNPAWIGPDTSDMTYLRNLVSQFVQHMEIVHFPPYYPSDAERADARLYAENVRSVMLHGANSKLVPLGMRPMRKSPDRFVGHVATTVSPQLSPTGGDAVKHAARQQQQQQQRTKNE